MKSIGFPPGSNNFRLAVMVILIALLMVVFFYYLEGAERELERRSIQQTNRIINSSMMVVFSELAVRGELNLLNEYIGANPFESMREFNLVPPTYQGVVQSISLTGDRVGWFYLEAERLVVYKGIFEESVLYYSLTLSFDDLDGNEKFEQGKDVVRRLFLKPLPQSKANY
ncbi:MAG: hypothetical protein OEY09_07745 [Gammaproteobacteria bacterium]|nr:hypothetical protein [Gammaproteobacteria bacterium]